MRFKVDENLHPAAADLLPSAGHDAMTVFDQGLRGHPDEDIATICQREQRAVVILDLDFSNIRQPPPQPHLHGSAGRGALPSAATHPKHPNRRS